jgi:LysM repeat protein/predicted nucleic acid-binding Zn ribbon protein
MGAIRLEAELNQPMVSSPQRRCPHCGAPVAQRAESCLTCGAVLKEGKKNRIRLPQGDLLLPLLLVAAIVVLWLWKPWQSDKPQAMVPAPNTPTVTPSPRATYAVAPTATPLNSPTPPPTATLPPNQVRHTVEGGETVISIAKLYGTTKKAILEANGLKESSILSVGQQLIIPLPIADTPTPTPTSTPSPTPFVYKVRSGDTLSSIAKRYNTTVEALMQANGISDATGLRAGTELIIVQPPDFKATMAYETYEVKAGDTLFTLSARFGLTVAEIKEVNALKGDQLSVGQELQIPVGTATPTSTPSPTPTLTPTPGPARPAPALLAPPDGVSFEGADAVILLNWASVGILGKDEWYVVRLQRVGARQQKEPHLEWTQATSWRLPPSLYVEGLVEPQVLVWQVSVMRKTGTTDGGAWIGEALSPTSSTRTFYWK